MGQQTNFVVYDGATTPVVHTLVGEGIATEKDGTVRARWKESLTGIPDYAQVRAAISKRRLPSGTYRLEVESTVPVMESVSGQNAAGYTAAPKVAYVDTLRTICLFHERGTVNGRRLARQMHTNLLGALSTAVTPVTVSPIPELIDQLIMVT